MRRLTFIGRFSRYKRRYKAKLLSSVWRIRLSGDPDQASIVGPLHITDIPNLLHYIDEGQGELFTIILQTWVKHGEDDGSEIGPEEVEELFDLIAGNANSEISQHPLTTQKFKQELIKLARQLRIS